MPNPAKGKRWQYIGAMYGTGLGGIAREDGDGKLRSYTANLCENRRQHRLVPQIRKPVSAADDNTAAFFGGRQGERGSTVGKQAEFGCRDLCLQQAGVDGMVGSKDRIKTRGRLGQHGLRIGNGKTGICAFLSRDSTKRPAVRPVSPKHRINSGRAAISSCANRLESFFPIACRTCSAGRIPLAAQDERAVSAPAPPESAMGFITLARSFQSIYARPALAVSAENNLHR